MDRNLLRDVWLPIGLDELLPGDPALYTPSDGLFAPSAFTPVVDSVQSRVFSGKGLRFKPGCRVPVGFTMTRVVPQLRTISGLRVKSQQTVVPLVFEVDPAGVPRLRRDTGLRSTALAADTATLADATDASGPYIAPGQAIQALLASAAFPVAFGARPVCECRRACGDGQREVTPDQCPGPLPGKSLVGLTCSAYSAVRGGQEFKLCGSNFIDGGVPGQHAGGAGRRAGRGLLLTPDTPPPHGAARRSQHPTAARGTSACAGESRPGIQRRGADGQRPREHRARAAARRGNRLPALESHHPGTALQNCIGARSPRIHRL